MDNVVSAPGLNLCTRMFESMVYCEREFEHGYWCDLAIQPSNFMLSLRREDSDMMIRLIDFGAATWEGDPVGEVDGVQINYSFASKARTEFPFNGELSNVIYITPFDLYIQHPPESMTL
jgi:hypothetical protein